MGPGLVVPLWRFDGWIHQDLISEHGFTAKYHSVRRFVQRQGRTRSLPFRRMECGPGEDAQVDFGTGAPILQLNGKRRRPHVFRIVLTSSTMITSNRPLEDRGKLIGDVSAAAAILDRFLHHAEVITITDMSYRLHSQARYSRSPNDPADSKKDDKKGKA